MTRKTWNRWFGTNLWGSSVPCLSVEQLPPPTVIDPYPIKRRIGWLFASRIVAGSKPARFLPSLAGAKPLTLRLEPWLRPQPCTYLRVYKEKFWKTKPLLQYCYKVDECSERNHTELIVVMNLISFESYCFETIGASFIRLYLHVHDRKDETAIHSKRILFAGVRGGKKGEFLWMSSSRPAFWFWVLTWNERAEKLLPSFRLPRSYMKNNKKSIQQHYIIKLIITINSQHHRTSRE